MEHWPSQTDLTTGRFCRENPSISSLGMDVYESKVPVICRILYFFSTSTAEYHPQKRKHIKYLSVFSKLVSCLSRLGDCNQYLLSGQQWHIIYLQETIPVFMYELNMPRRHHWRLHICNRSARKDWHTAVNSILTWLGQIEEWMLPLFELGGGGKAKRGIDRVSVLREQAT